jgi:membrane protein implicated in regulation of membrane protease activity
MGTVTLGVLLLNVGAFGAIASALAFGEFSAPVFLFVVLAVIGGYIAWKGSQKADKGRPDRR